jgi:hypothetical protein
MSTSKKEYNKFGTKDVEIECPSVSDASEKSEDKEISEATER